MKKALTLITLTASLAAASTSHAAGVTVTLACETNANDLRSCTEGANRWAKATGNTVKLFQAAKNTNDSLSLYQQQLAAKSSDIDVYMMDVVWPGLISQHLVDLNGKIPAATLSQYFKPLIAADTVNGKLVALPWFTDAGLLFYRTDLLKKYGFNKAPGTWDELAAMAAKIQAGEQPKNKSFAGFVFQGKDYEGLTCDALEWVNSFGGGSVVDASGKITINNPNAAKALDTAASWIKKISPAGVTTYAEDESLGIFQSGNAAFLRSWPYVFAKGNEPDSRIKGLIGVAPLPKGGASGKPSATLGGWQLGVSAYSKNQAAAIDLVKYLAGPVEQKIRATAPGLSYNPTIPALYKDKDLVAARPFMSKLYDVFINAVARPSGATKGKYNQVSQAFSGTAHDVLTGKANGTQAVSQLATSLARIKGSGW